MFTISFHICKNKSLRVSICQYNKITWRTINYDNVTKRKHRLRSPDHPYRTLIIGGSGSVKTNAVPNLIKQQDDDDYSIIDKIYLNVKDTHETKYQYLIKNAKIMVLKIWKI